MLFHELVLFYGEDDKLRDLSHSKSTWTEFVQGTVLKQWDEGNAYRIELQSGSKTQV